MCIKGWDGMYTFLGGCSISYVPYDYEIIQMIRNDKKIADNEPIKKR
jgi:hypothetical protein